MSDEALRHQLASVRQAVLFGGTFDPPHRAHVALATHTLRRLDADALIVVPAGRSPFKRDLSQTPAHHRMQMTRLAMRDVPGAVVLGWEADRGDGLLSYTIDTARRLRGLLPEHAALRLLIGADQAMSFAQWKDAEQLAQTAPPVVLARPPHGIESVQRWLDDEAPAFMRRFEVIDAPLMDISATALRKALADGRDTGDALAPEVLGYIRTHGLYAVSPAE